MIEGGLWDGLGVVFSHSIKLQHKRRLRHGKMIEKVQALLGNRAFIDVSVDI